MPESLNYTDKMLLTDKLVTSEYQKEWTENNPNSKLEEIKDKVESIRKKSPEIDKLKSLIKSRDYREFQRVVGVTPYDGKLGKNSLRYLGIYVDKTLKNDSVITQTNNRLNSFLMDTGHIQNVVDTTRIQQHEQEYLNQYESMSEAKYNNLFSGKENLQQGQLGDCYLVSGINELARAQHFDTLMRTSIACVKWKNGDRGYEIKIPLGEPSGRKILIKDSELTVAKIRGNLGYKLLELAYAKNKLRPNNKKGNQYKPISSEELKKISGGWTHEVLRTFLGKNNISFNDFGTQSNFKMGKTLSQSPDSSKKQIEGFLKNYVPNIGNKFVSLASKLGHTDHESYEIGGKTIYCKHAYLISNVLKDSKGNIKYITVLNPWNSQGDGKNYQNFTLNEFFNGFSCIQQGKINTSSFLNSNS